MGPEKGVGNETVVVRPAPPRPPCPEGYKLVELIGRGGMGEVWLARDLKLGRCVAIKYLHVGAGEHDLARFRREAETASRLSHPGVVTIYAVGQAQGRSYIVMRLVRGRTLAAWPREDVRGLVRIVRDAARAVDHAHRHGVLHRDLKPSNVLLEEREDGEPEVVVSDFGLATWLLGGSRLTLSGQTVGTPPYMPPEQVVGDPTGPRGDVYSLGATLYELLKGRPPFTGDTPLQILRRVVEEEPEPVDGPLGAAVGKAMEKRPERRYPTAAAFADDLDRWLADQTVLAPKRGPLLRLHRRLERRKAWILGLAAAGLLAALPWMTGSSEPPTSSADANEFLLAWVTGRSDRLRVGERTLRELEETLAREPGSATARLWRARIRRLLGKPEEVDVPALERAHAAAFRGEETPPELKDDFLQGAAALRRGDAERAIATLTRYLGTSAWDARAYVLRGRARGPGAATEEDAARAAELAPADPEIAFECGRLLHEARRYAAAERQYTRALMLSPGWAAPTAARGALYAEQRLFEKAEADLRAAWELDRRDTPSLAKLGDLFVEQGRFTEAEAAYTRAEAWLSRARLYQARRQHALAEEDCTRVISSDPSRAEAYVERGHARRAAGRSAEAVEDWRKALELDEALRGRVGPWLEAVDK